MNRHRARQLLQVGLAATCVIAMSGCTGQTIDGGGAKSSSDAQANDGGAMTDGCDHYSGSNPSWDQFVQDLTAYYSVIQSPADAKAGVDAALDDYIKRRFDAMREGAAAEITTWLCSVRIKPTAEEAAQANDDPLTQQLLSHQRGFTLWSALLQLQCLGGSPDVTLNTTRTPAEVADKLRQTLCP